ncbi:tail fiber domain-containing protein [Bradyrhizobium sp.]
MSGANAASNVGSIAGQFINTHTGTSSTNTGVVGSADGATHNIGVYGITSSTDADDTGVYGYASGTSGVTYGVYGLNNSATGYAGYFQNSNGGYAAAFMGGKVGIGTAQPQSLVHAYGGEVQVGTSGNACTSLRGGAIRFSGSTLYYCDGTSTWQTVGGGSGTVTSSSAGQVAYYQSTGTTVIGTSTLNISSGNVGIGTTSPTNLLSLSGSAAQTIWMERNPTSNTAGNNLTVQASGATSGATNKNGGNLVLSSGTSTGTGTSQIQFQTSNAGSSGTTDSSATTQMTITGAGNVGIGTATPNANLAVAGNVAFGAVSNTNAGAWPFTVHMGTDVNINFRNESSVAAIQSINDAGSAGANLVLDAPNTIFTHNVGIANTSPSYTLQVNGSVAGTSAYVNTSDMRLKKNILPLDIGLNIVTQLKPVTFEWKDEAVKRLRSTGADGKPLKLPVEDRGRYDPAMQGKQIGFIAQDVEKILPSVIVTEPNAEKTKGMKYSELIPVLVKAIQEQQAEIDDLKKRIR